LKLVVVVDEVQERVIGKRWKPRTKAMVHPTSYTIGQARPIVLTRAARAEVKKRWAKTTPEERKVVSQRMHEAKATKRLRTSTQK
jgi:hypothetical protein